MRYNAPAVSGGFVKVEWSGLREVIDGYGEVGREQLPFATALALTRTARRGKGLMYAEFRRKFDRPIPFLTSGERNLDDDRLGVLWVDKATKERPSAAFYMKTNPLGGKNPYSIEDLLKQHFISGARVPKVLELLLRQWGLMTAGEYIIPGKAAQMDSYGNISKGQLQQIISQLGIVRSGFDNAPTNSARSKRNVKRAGAIFWSFGPQGSAPGAAKIDKKTGLTYGAAGRTGKKNHLWKGAYVRDGKSVHPLLIVVRKTPIYKQRISMQELAERAVTLFFADEFEKALEQAVNSAGKLKGGSTRAERVADFRNRAFR